MKKTLCFLLCVALLNAPAFAASKKKSDPTATPTPSPTPYVTQAPTPTPIPILTSSQYVLQWKNDAERGMNYMIPTHWEETSSGERYRVYSEPTNDGVSGFRVAFVNKKKASDPDASKMRSELKALIEEMKAVYADFYWDGEILRDKKLVKFTGYAAEYTYTDYNGEPMQGYVIISKYDRRIYCMNFSGPVARFADMQYILNRILESVTRVS